VAEDEAAVVGHVSLTRAWVDDPDYYSRLGFVAAGPLGFRPPSVRIPERAFQVWPTPAYHGGLSGALVYPDVFWRHDAVGLRG
jgi:putative acetyltransferase